MNPPTVRVVYLTDSPDSPDSPAAREAGGTLAAGAAAVRPRSLQTTVPLPLLAAIGERVAAGAARMQDIQGMPGMRERAPVAPGAAGAPDEPARLERFGLQLQELAQVAARAQQLRHESVDLGLALLQTVAEWSGEADRLGVELHGPACSEPVRANPAALKHMLDLLVEHALQQGRVVRLEIEAPAAGSGAHGEPTVRVVARVSSEPASSSPTRETLAWALLQWFARALGLVPLREAVPRGERLTLAWPRP